MKINDEICLHCEGIELGRLNIDAITERAILGCGKVGNKWGIEVWLPLSQLTFWNSEPQILQDSNTAVFDCSIAFWLAKQKNLL